jgi:hypothetical protein
MPSVLGSRRPLRRTSGTVLLRWWQPTRPVFAGSLRSIAHQIGQLHIDVAKGVIDRNGSIAIAIRPAAKGPQQQRGERGPMTTRQGTRHRGAGAQHGQSLHALGQLDAPHWHGRLHRWHQRGFAVGRLSGEARIDNHQGAGLSPLRQRLQHVSTQHPACSDAVFLGWASTPNKMPSLACTSGAR